MVDGTSARSQQLVLILAVRDKFSHLYLTAANWIVAKSFNYSSFYLLSASIADIFPEQKTEIAAISRHRWIKTTIYKLCIEYIQCKSESEVEFDIQMLECIDLLNWLRKIKQRIQMADPSDSHSTLDDFVTMCSVNGVRMRTLSNYGCITMFVLYSTY